ncbi:nucleotide-binding domain containing protein, partial [Mycobacterium tuberculosis]
QIRYALCNGFEGIFIPSERLLMPEEAAATRKQLVDQALAILNAGGSPLLYTALGPEDESIGAIQSRLAAMGYQGADSGRLLGEQLGLLTKEIIERGGLRRFVVAGGDTSGFVTRQLGVYALEAVMPIAPGGPLCKGYSEDDRFDGIQFVLKGGQVGKDNFFAAVRDAGQAR